MCEITIYVGEKTEKGKVMERVSSYEFDFGEKRLIAYRLLDTEKEFNFKHIDRISWSEFDDSLVIEGKLESIIEKSENKD